MVRDDTHWVKINTKHKAQKRVQSVPFVVGVVGCVREAHGARNRRIFTKLLKIQAFS
jgi:hypothetical protein